MRPRTYTYVLAVAWERSLTLMLLYCLPANYYWVGIMVGAMEHTYLGTYLPI